MSYILPFEQCRMSDVDVVGGKNASLGEMISQLANAGVRVPALGNPGQGRRLPAGAAVAGAVGHTRMVRAGGRSRLDHPAPGRRSGHVSDGSERPAGVFHHQPSGPDHPAAGTEWRTGRRGRRVPHHEPRHLQGVAVHGSGHD